MTTLTTMTSDHISELQQLMVMSKLAETIECTTLDGYGLTSRYVVMGGMPFDFRTFVMFTTGLLRSEGHGPFDERALNDLRTLWNTLEYKFVPHEPKQKPIRLGVIYAPYMPAIKWQPSDEYREKQTDNDTIRTIYETIKDMARKYSGQEDDDSNYSVWSRHDLDYKPLLAEVYSKFTEQ